MNIFFLAGIPRAGNTLLASIMNQNPDVKVTANSIVMEIARNIESQRTSEVFLNFPDHKSLDNILSNLYSNYYKDWNCKYIIDRNYLAVTLSKMSNGLKVLKKCLKNKLKIIILVREFLEVLQSVLKNIREKPHIPPFGAPLDFGQATDYIGASSGRYTDESLCGMLASRDTAIYKGFLGARLLSNTFPKENLHFVHYNARNENPKITIDNIYNFLEIPSFEHRFENLNQLEINGVKYDDTMMAFGRDLHKVKEDKISFTEHKPLPKSIVEKYGDLNLLKGMI